jgi:hypothetical protein
MLGNGIDCHLFCIQVDLFARGYPRNVNRRIQSFLPLRKVQIFTKTLIDYCNEVVSMSVVDVIKSSYLVLL